MIVKELDLKNTRSWIVKSGKETIIVIMCEGELFFLKEIDVTELTLLDLGIGG